MKYPCTYFAIWLPGGWCEDLAFFMIFPMLPFYFKEIYQEGTSPILLFQHIYYCNHKRNLIHDKLLHNFSVPWKKLKNWINHPPNFSTINLEGDCVQFYYKKEAINIPLKRYVIRQNIPTCKMQLIISEAIFACGVSSSLQKGFRLCSKHDSQRSIRAFPCFSMDSVSLMAEVIRVIQISTTAWSLSFVW